MSIPLTIQATVIHESSTLAHIRMVANRRWPASTGTNLTWISLGRAVISGDLIDHDYDWDGQQPAEV